MTYRSKFIFLSLSFALLATQNVFPKEKHLLSGSFDAEFLKRSILSSRTWHPFPKYAERSEWTRTNENIRKGIIDRAEAFLQAGWELPKATEFLEYTRNGNRSRYEAVSFGRREHLATLVLAECMEGKGRFFDDIVNGIWTICEETYWGVPAHVGLQKRGPGLPDVSEPTVDLFAAETGMLISWTYYLLGDELNTISPLIPERMRSEVQRRILSVNLQRDDFWWMGFGRTVNNWNPWICSNWLTAVLVFEEDPDQRAASVHKILVCLDNFLDPYPRDGGCDEGPSYWGRAGGSLFDCLELLRSASNDSINVYDNPLIREIGKYIYRVYIHDQYFINFADAPAKNVADASLIFRYGRSINDGIMESFGSFLARKQRLGEEAPRGPFRSLGRFLPMLFTLPQLSKIEPREPLLRDFWLPDLQVMGARSSEASAKGFYLAAKGGHNAESHNHNDVGNFVIYLDGEPVVIDVGVETYTAKTFSKDRYSIWTMQSAYHNLPTINGFMQHEGAEFRSKDVSYSADDNAASLSLDIAGAYPGGAMVKTWKRSIRLNRGENVTLTDRYELGEARQPLTLSLMTAYAPAIRGEGTIRLVPDAERHAGGTVLLLYDAKKFSGTVETIKVEDPRLRSSWGEGIYRIVLTSKLNVLQDEYSIVFREE